MERAVREASRERAIGDLENARRSPSRPTGRASRGSGTRAGDRRDHILPGNREYVEGDSSTAPPARGGGGAEPGSGDGQEDAFRFVLTREEFLSIFLDDLELPDLAKRGLSTRRKTACGAPAITTSGSPANLSLGRTMQMSLARRIALGRPSTRGDRAARGGARRRHGRRRRGRCLPRTAHALRARMLRIPYIDPVDMRYRRFERFPKPVAQAVMFCLMDVSGSMTEHMKDLAKRFFMLLHVFLTRRYKRVEIVFIRHTDKAQEVDEETFFRSRRDRRHRGVLRAGGNARIVNERYDPAELEHLCRPGVRRRQCARATMSGRAQLLQEDILPLCQYFAYLEVAQPNADAAPGLCRRQLALEDLRAARSRRRANFQMRRVSRRDQIFRCSANCSSAATSAERRRRHERAPCCSKARTGTSTRSRRIHDAVEDIAVGELGLDVYPNQIEVITAEQMLDAYASTGMPLFYQHWSFGKHFAHHESIYRKGLQGLAYEIVINSNPCISYIMEENTRDDAGAGHRPRGLRP